MEQGDTPPSDQGPERPAGGDEELELSFTDDDINALLDDVASPTQHDPVVPHNWGVQSRQAVPLPTSSKRLGIVMVGVLAALLMLSPLLINLLTGSKPPVDDAWRTLDAYSRATSADKDVETELSSTQRALLATATRSFDKDGGEILALPGENGVCWSVRLAQGASPVEADPAVCS